MPDLAVGDLLGSSLMNLLILAGIDLMSQTGRRMLSREAASHALSATLSIALTALVGMAVLTGGRLPAVELLGIDGWTWAVGVAWMLGARMLFIDQRISARVAAESGMHPAEEASEGFGLGAAIGNTFGSNAFNMALLVPLDACHPGSLVVAASSLAPLPRGRPMS